MSDISFSIINNKVVMKLSVDEAEDMYSDLIVAIESGNTSEEVKDIARKAKDCIEYAKKFQER